MDQPIQQPAQAGAETKLPIKTKIAAWWMIGLGAIMLLMWFLGVLYFSILQSTGFFITSILSSFKIGLYPIVSSFNIGSDSFFSFFDVYDYWAMIVPYILFTILGIFILFRKKWAWILMVIILSTGSFWIIFEAVSGFVLLRNFQWQLAFIPPLFLLFPLIFLLLSGKESFGVILSKLEISIMILAPLFVYFSNWLILSNITYPSFGGIPLESSLYTNVNPLALIIPIAVFLLFKKFLSNRLKGHSLALIVFLISFIILFLTGGFNGFISKVAAQTDSASFCKLAFNDVFSNFEKNYCINTVAIKTQNEKLCENTAYKINCYGEIAYAKKDINLCQKLSEDYFLFRCEREVKELQLSAIKSLCEKKHTEQEKNECTYQELIRINHPKLQEALFEAAAQLDNFQLCEELGEKDYPMGECKIKQTQYGSSLAGLTDCFLDREKVDCFEKFIDKTKDPRICDDLKDDVNIDTCLYVASYKLNDPALCGKIKFQFWLQLCSWQVGLFVK